jgi:hypothetical protein
MYKANVAVRSEIRTKNSKLSQYHVEFLYTEPVVRKGTARI